ncbi:MAG: hypothetical protein AAB617_02465 [Patescibacteria group bacterium]
MLSKADAWLLELTEKLVKRFNWLTGKDNFWLAKRVFFASGLFMFIWVCEWNQYFVPLAFVAGAFHIFIWITVASLSESKAVTDSIEGVKNLRYVNAIRWIRIYVVLASFVVVYIDSSKALLIFLCVNRLLDILGVYLISINKPPFKRSMAIEWLKNKINELTRSLDPTPTPQPV